MANPESKVPMERTAKQ
jgi:hypothetical protein